MLDAGDVLPLPEESLPSQTPDTKLACGHSGDSVTQRVGQAVFNITTGLAEGCDKASRHERMLQEFTSRFYTSTGKATICCRFALTNFDWSGGCESDHWRGFPNPLPVT